jgi:transposase
MLAKTHDSEEVIERVAALDIGKAELVCCVRVPDEDRPGRRLQEVESYSVMTRPLLGMADRLTCLGVTRVVMEATGDYWKPVVRHEALFDCAGVRGLRRRAVAAA